MYEAITKQTQTVLTELLDQAKLKPGALLVLGCSSSEMVGQRIGKGSSMEAAQAAFRGLYPMLQERGIHLAVQCCEAVTAWNAFSDPVAVETIRADAGIDIGGTLIGMHLRHVAVPVRTSLDHIGEAIVLCARTRPKYIGGPRAIYPE